MTVIPDSIEPYVGYKALSVIHTTQLQLVSPSYRNVWSPKHRFRAICGNNRQDWEWQAVRSINAKPGPVNDEDETGFSLNAQSSSHTRSAEISKPQTTLPHGMDWSWEPIPHQVASNDCRCGIYVADSPGRCASYVQPMASVICKVALWGTVTRGENGARGQYAYPQTIEYVMGLNNEQIVRLADDYGLTLPEGTPPNTSELGMVNFMTTFTFAPVNHWNTTNDLTITSATIPQIAWTTTDTLDNITWEVT